MKILILRIFCQKIFLLWFKVCKNLGIPRKISHENFYWEPLFPKLPFVFPSHFLFMLDSVRGLVRLRGYSQTINDDNEHRGNRRLNSRLSNPHLWRPIAGKKSSTLPWIVRSFDFFEQQMVTKDRWFNCLLIVVNQLQQSLWCAVICWSRLSVVFLLTRFRMRHICVSDFRTTILSSKTQRTRPLSSDAQINLHWSLQQTHWTSTSKLWIQNCGCRKTQQTQPVATHDGSQTFPRCVQWTWWINVAHDLLAGSSQPLSCLVGLWCGRATMWCSWANCHAQCLLGIKCFVLWDSAMPLTKKQIYCSCAMNEKCIHSRVVHGGIKHLALVAVDPSRTLFWLPHSIFSLGVSSQDVMAHLERFPRRSLWWIMPCQQCAQESNTSFVHSSTQHPTCSQTQEKCWMHIDWLTWWRVVPCQPWMPFWSSEQMTKPLLLAVNWTLMTWLHTWAVMMMMVRVMPVLIPTTKSTYVIWWQKGQRNSIFQILLWMNLSGPFWVSKMTFYVKRCPKGCLPCNAHHNLSVRTLSWRQSQVPC